MATRIQRSISLIAVILFIITSSSLTIAVIVSSMQSDKKNTSSSNNATPPKNPTVRLQGTQMPNFTPVADVPSLQIIDLKNGNGATVKPGDNVNVDYTGAVAATGFVFQSSLDSGQPVSFGLNNVITGWKNGMVGMKVGGERRLIIPASQAYGANPPAGSGIPPNAPLVFDVTLHKIN